MSGAHIPPEHFSIALGELMEMARDISDVCHPIGRVAECHYMRRAKQIDSDEDPLDRVPLAIEIATLNQLAHQIKITRAMLEIVEEKNRQLDGANR